VDIFREELGQSRASHGFNLSDFKSRESEKDQQPDCGRLRHTVIQKVVHWGEQKKQRVAQNAASFKRHQHEIRKHTTTSQQTPKKLGHHSLILSTISAATLQVHELAGNAISRSIDHDSCFVLLLFLLTTATHCNEFPKEEFQIREQQKLDQDEHGIELQRI